MTNQNKKLSTEASLIHQQLKQTIISAIHNNDQELRFSDFMNYALYTPKLGYYQNALYTFGKKGDFITAPEMGDLFGFCIANSFKNFDQSPINILEIGAGSGVLAKTLLNATTGNFLLENYFILEPSAVLQELQKQTLSQIAPSLLDKVSWLSSLPDDFSGVIIANEVMDAIPVDVIQFESERWFYRMVEWNGKDFVWRSNNNQVQVSDKQLPNSLKKNESFSQGYTTEIRPHLSAWIKSLSDCLQQGHILLIDYGYPEKEYYHPQRHRGSLKCFSRHQSHNNPLEYVGLQDITAHVNFTQVAQAAVDAGLSVDGMTTQAGFLLENGILDFAPKSEKPNTEDYQFSQQVQKLTSPEQMGEVVKVMALSKKPAKTIQGFSLQDQLHRL